MTNKQLESYRDKILRIKAKVLIQKNRPYSEVSLEKLLDIKYEFLNKYSDYIAQDDYGSPCPVPDDEIYKFEYACAEITNRELEERRRYFY